MGRHPPSLAESSHGRWVRHFGTKMAEGASLFRPTGSGFAAGNYFWRANKANSSVRFFTDAPLRGAPVRVEPR